MLGGTAERLFYRASNYTHKDFKDQDVQFLFLKKKNWETTPPFHTVQDSQRSSLCLLHLLLGTRKHRGTMEEATGEKDPEFPMQQRISRKVQVLTSTHGSLLLRKMTKNQKGDRINNTQIHHTTLC